MDWNDYINYWNNYYSAWYKNPSTMDRDPFFQGKSTLVKDEIPEPYYFGGIFPQNGESFAADSIEAVVLNINPGQRGSGDWVKCWANRNDPSAFIIHDCHDYNSVNANYNSLTTPNNLVPGQIWWSEERFKWMDRFFGRPVDRNLVMSIEPCQWHSVAANSIDFSSLKKDPDFLNDYLKYVIDPAADAIRGSRLKGASGKPFGLWFGNKGLRDIMVDAFNFKVTLLADAEHPLTGWPLNKNGKEIRRKYELLEGVDSDGKECRFLFLTYSNVGVHSPSPAFALIDQLIKQMI